MPRYEHSDDKHIVLKLKSGYNIGLEISKIQNVEKNQSTEKIVEKALESLSLSTDEKLLAKWIKNFFK